MFQPLQRGMRPLSVLRTSFPIKGQEAVVAWKFSLGLSALAFPAPSRGRMPARQEGVFTKRLSDKQTGRVIVIYGDKKDPMTK